MNEHPKLTLNMVGPVAEDVARDYPNRAISGPDCRYADADATVPRCLVGHVLHRLGWSVTELRELDQTELPSASTAIYDLIDYGKIDADDKARRFLANLQFRQDMGHKWEDVINFAVGRL